MSDNTLNSPGVFRGSARLATVHDLTELKNYLESIIAGGKEIGPSGYIPWIYKPTGEVDIDTLFPDLVERFETRTGVDILRNGRRYATNVKTFNIQGNYVNLALDENDVLTWYIDEPSNTLPSFNEANRFGTALVKIVTELVEDMVAASSDNPNIYGDWEPGTKVCGINANGSTTYDPITFTTQGPTYAPNLSSFFEVLVKDAAGATIARFVSECVRGDTAPNSYLNAGSADSTQEIFIKIANFKEAGNGYSFIPTFDVNLARILNLTGRRFEVEIIHHVGDIEYSYNSDPMLYNCGVVPTIEGISVSVVSQTSGGSFITYSSGIKYAKNATVIARMSRINDLNNMAAVENPIHPNFDIADLSTVEVIPEDYDHSIDKISTFKMKFNVKEGLALSDASTGTIRVENAYALSESYPVEVPVLANTTSSTAKRSDKLNEYFTDEAFRVQSNFAADAASIGEYATAISWDSTQSLLDYDEGRGLMVVPGKGLAYPHGNWSRFLPAGSPNYDIVSFLSNEKYFARTFVGNEKVKFGGVFVFEGLTKSEFFDDRLSIIISCTFGTRWFNLKKVRNMDSAIISNGEAIDATGIMTGIEEKFGKLYVSWAYPTGVSSNQGLYFKLGMKPTSPFTIKSISLLNTDEEEDW